jgi:hypothetical protein
MLVAPRPGFKYRDTLTKQLVLEEGFEADPTDLDIHRALECGDLVPVEMAAPGAQQPAPKAKDAGK